MRRLTALEIQDRKALLSARALFDRAQMTLAVHDVRAAVMPPAVTSGAATHRGAALLIGLAAPIFGMSRVGRWLRIASWALAAWRVARSWRSLGSR